MPRARYRTAGEGYRTAGEGSPYHGGNFTVLRGKDRRTAGEISPYYGGSQVAELPLPMGNFSFARRTLVLLSLLCLCFVNNREYLKDILATGRNMGGDAP